MATLNSRIELLTEKIVKAAKAYTKLSRFSRRNWRYGYVFSVCVGWWLLKAFTTLADIPFPQPDAVLLAFVALLGLACYFILAWLISLPLATLVTVLVNPELQRMTPCKGSLLWRASRYLCRYLLIFGPFMVGSASFPGLAALGVHFAPRFGMAWLGWLSLLGSILAMMLVLWLTKILYSKSGDQFLHFDNDATPPFPFVGVAISSSVIAYVWAFVILEATILLAGWAQITDDNTYIFSILGAILVWQFLVVTVQLHYKIKGVVFAGLPILFVISIVHGPTLGGLALRVCEFGGGIPISFTANLAELKNADSKYQSHSQRINGCLVLWIGTQVSIQRPTNNTNRLGPCRLSPHTKNKLGKVIVPTTVDTINRSDVLDIFSVGRWR